MPTIDPAEFEEGGVLYKGNGTHAELDERPYDPALHPQGSTKWAEHQTSMDAETSEDRYSRQHAKSLAKINAANAAISEQAELHKQELAKQAALKQATLTELLDQLGEVEGRNVRLLAYLRALDAGHGSQAERQLHADMLCLRMVRYMLEGRAE